MRIKPFFWVLLTNLLGIFFSLFSQEPLEQDFPVLYKGRFRPADAYARLWLYDLYHAQSLRSEDLPLFQTQSPSALSWLWRLDFQGHAAFEKAPLFWVPSAEVKQLAGLDPLKNRFSYQELDRALYQNQVSSQSILFRLMAYHFLHGYSESANRSQSEKIELRQLHPGLWAQWSGDRLVVAAVPDGSPWPFLRPGQVFASIKREQASQFFQQDRKLAEDFSNLMLALQQFKELQGAEAKNEQAFKSRFAQLKATSLPPKQIEAVLEKEYPLLQRLKTAGNLFKALPSRFETTEWFPLKALKLQTYQLQTQQLAPIGNFSLYSNEEFEEIRQAYLAWEQAVLTSAPLEQQSAFYRRLAESLNQAYRLLAGTPYQEAAGKALYFPTFNQLRAESAYYQYPWIKILILLYGLSALLLTCFYRLPPSSRIRKGVVALLIGAFSFHTLLLFWRCYILNRPPVSNMFETVIYVPWVAVLCGLALGYLRQNALVLIAASTSSVLLLILLELTDLNHSLDQVQAVLDSQFWLMIHVLLVVGSYGVFILGSLLGHFYLGSFLYHRKRTSSMLLVSQLILQTLYVGTALLITGTILGGVWAAESWGRFWDWDPKESWAFISSCLYLIWIHAYRFHRIADFGLAFGAVSGFLAISFTWYGVNYILGTGLHSYGFGSGGELYYYGFILAEVFFLILALLVYRNTCLPHASRSHFIER